MGQAYFFNMTAQPAALLVNNFVQDSIAALPSSAPYTPNKNGQTYNRYNTGAPQQNQFGNTNTVNYSLGTGGGGGNVNVTVNVNVHAYPIGQDILLYLFQDAVVVMVVSDNNAYFGLTGSKITVDPNVEESKLSNLQAKTA